MIILEFILQKLNQRQYGGKRGTSRDYLIVSMIDRIKQALDDPGNNLDILN